MHRHSTRVQARIIAPRFCPYCSTCSKKISEGVGRLPQISRVYRRKEKQVKLISKQYIKPIVALCILFGSLGGDVASAQPVMRRQGSSGNPVIDWNAIAQNAIVTVGGQPIQRSQLWITLVHVAMYDAVVSINGGYEQFKVTPAHLRPASPEAAAIAAAHGVLVKLLPTQQATLAAERANSLAAIQGA